MKLRTVISFFFAIWSISGWAQITFERSYDYGHGEAARKVIQTSDGGYLLAGRHTLAIFNSQGLLIKTDEYGNEQWHNMFWAGCDTEIHDVKQLEDGGFILVGDHCVMGEAANLFLARTDEFGDTLWLRSFGSNVDDRGRGVVVMSDGGFALSGATGNPTLARLIRTDGDGNVVWNKEYLPDEATNSVFESLAITEDGSLIMCGTATFPDLERQNLLYVVKADADGNLLWERWFGGSENDQGMAVTAIPGGGVYAAGYTWSFGAGHYDMYLIRLTEEGDTLWTATVGTQYEEAAKDVVCTVEGEAVLVGDGFSGPGASSGQYGIIASIVSTQGELIWTQRYERGDGNSMYGNGAFLCSDGGYAFCGLSDYDAHLIKTDQEGRLVGISDPTVDHEALLLYPNPVTDVCHVRFPPSWAGARSVKIDMFNSVGAVVLSTTVPILSSSMSITVEHLSPGLYTVQFRSEQHLSNLKLIVR